MDKDLQTMGEAIQSVGIGGIAQGRRKYVPVGSGKIVHDFYSPEQSPRSPHSGLFQREPWAAPERHLTMGWTPNGGESYPDRVRLMEGVVSAGLGVVFQGCKKQDVFSRAYMDVFMAALKDHPKARTIINPPLRFPKNLHPNTDATLNVRKVFGIATGSGPKGFAVTQELQIETA